MDEIDAATEPPADIVLFHLGAPRIAAAYRLSQAQREPPNSLLLARELPNLWDAVEQSHARADWEMVVAFRETLQPFLDLQGHWKESVRLNQWAREAAQELGNTLSAARWTHDQADMLQQRGDYREAEQLYKASEERYRDLGNDEMALKSRHMRALVVRAQGRLAEAETLSESTVSEARQLGLDRWLAHPLYVRALLARDRGDFSSARQWVQEGLSLLDEREEQAMVAQCHHFLGDIALREGRWSEARTCLGASLQISRQVGIRRRVVATQRALGDLMRLEGHFDEAAKAYREAIGIASDVDDQPQLAQLYLSRARLAADRECVAEEGDSLQAALSTFHQVGDSRGIVLSALLLARWHLRQMQWRSVLSLVLVALRTAWSVRLIHPRALWDLLRHWRKP